MEFAAWVGKRSWRKEEMVENVEERKVKDGLRGMWGSKEKREREYAGKTRGKAETGGGMSEYD